jgi:hypothetical protein
MQLIAYIIERKVMNLLKRFVWLCFYIPAVMKTRINLTFMRLKMFFNRVIAWPLALITGLFAGLKAGAGAIRRGLSGKDKTV